MSFRYAFPRFSRMMGPNGGGFGRRRGAGPFCRLNYGDRFMPASRMRSPFCRRAEWLEGQEFDSSPRGFRDWFNWKPWWYRDDYVNKLQDKAVDVKLTDRAYEVTLNVDQFNPENIEVKVLNNRVIISGKQVAEEDDLGMISQEFTREINIPEDVDMDSIHSVLTDDGQLLIKGDLKQSGESRTRTVNIDRQ